MGRKPAKKRPVRKEGLNRPYNDGQWTEARFKSFIVSALRGARWGPRHEAVKLAFVRRDYNPKTGKPCKLHRCAKCLGLFPQKDVQADHIDPVIGPEGFVDWNTFIQRMFVEKEGYQVLCKKCHSLVTLQERFDLDEAGAIAHSEAIRFSKLPVAEQKLALTQLGLAAGGNAAVRRTTYHQHLLNPQSK